MYRTILTVCIHLVVTWIPVAGAAWADVRPTSPVFLVNLDAPERGFAIVRAANLDDALATPGDASAGASGDRLDALITSCRPNEGGQPPPTVPIVERLYVCAECLKAYTETRFLTSREDTAVLIVLYDGARIPDSRMIAAVFEETSRQSELVATAKALMALTQRETRVPPKPTCIAFTHTLQNKRSYLRVIVSAPAKEEPARSASTSAAPRLIQTPAAGATTAAAPPAETLESARVVLGPEERWFVSADFAIAKASVKFATSPTVSDELVKNKDFFVGVNYALADLLSDRTAVLQRRGFLEELVIKFQLTPSREPWNAWGLGLGMRGYRLKTITWNMDVVHPYVAVSRQRAETGGRQWRVVAGFGFDPRSLQRQ